MPALGAPLEERDRVDLKDLRELFKHIDSRGMLFPFKHPDVIPINICTVGELLLRYALGMPQRP